MKCVECANATETFCPLCPPQATAVCPDMPAFENTCTADHTRKAHVPKLTGPGSRQTEANLIVKGLRSDVAGLIYNHAAERAVLLNQAAAAEAHAANAEARHAALAKFLGAAYPEALAHAKKDGLA